MRHVRIINEFIYDFDKEKKNRMLGFLATKFVKGWTIDDDNEQSNFVLNRTVLRVLWLKNNNNTMESFEAIIKQFRTAHWATNKCAWLICKVSIFELCSEYTLRWRSWCFFFWFFHSLFSTESIFLALIKSILQIWNFVQFDSFEIIVTDCSKE